MAVFLVATNCVDNISTATQSSYVIKSRQVNDISEALTLLRRFVPGPTSSLQRCEKYAVLLHMLSSSVVDQFAIAELGLASKETVRGKLKTIDIETLRQLYMDGINNILAPTSKLDPAVIELADCLSQKFKNIDFKARSYLKEIQETIDQYKSILEMPITFLLDPKVVHPSIPSNELKPSIRQALFHIFNGRISPFYTKFPLEYQKSPSYISANSDASKNTNDPIQKTTTLDSKPSLKSEAEVKKANDSAVEESQLNLTQEEHDYINTLLAAIVKVQQALVVETQLNDRCKAYNKVIQSDQDTLNDKLIDEAIGEVLKHGQKVEGNEVEPFVPEKTLRDNFVFIVSTFGPHELGDEAWVDLVYCVSQWQQVDPEVREFISSPKLIGEIEEIMNNAEKAALEAGGENNNTPSNVSAVGNDQAPPK